MKGASSVGCNLYNRVACKITPWRHKHSASSNLATPNSFSSQISYECWDLRFSDTNLSLEITSQCFHWIVSRPWWWLEHSAVETNWGRLSVTNLSSENNLSMFWLNAPVVIRAKVKNCEQTLLSLANISHALLRMHYLIGGQRSVRIAGTLWWGGREGEAILTGLLTPASSVGLCLLVCGSLPPPTYINTLVTDPGNGL